MPDDRDVSRTPERRPDGTMMPGHSANPRGRPARSRNMLTLFNEKRDELISTKVDGRVVKMTRLEVWVTNLWNKALTLDPKASQTLMTVLRASGQLEPTASEKMDLSEADGATLDALVARLVAARQDDQNE